MQEFPPLGALAVDRTVDIPLHRQLYIELRRMIEERSLAAGSAMPSSRSLAEDLGIARNTVNSAYDQLASEGYLVISPRSRPTVVDLPDPPARSADVRDGKARRVVSARGKLMLEQPSYHGTPGHLSFHPGMPDADNFPFNTWSSLLARRAKAARHDLFGTYNVTGHPALREAIATYVRAARGVRCTPEQIVVTTGAQAGLDLLARLLLDPGETAWVEEPGYYGAQAAFVAAGATLAPLFVDSPGLAAGTARRRRPARHLRHAFLPASARRHHADGAAPATPRHRRTCRCLDHRGRFRRRIQLRSASRSPATQGADRSDRVIYLGTFAKTVVSGAADWASWSCRRCYEPGIAQAISITGQFAPLLLQAALADFINEGHMTRHLRRMRRIYAARRRVFCQLVEAHLGDWMMLRPGKAGIQVVGTMRRT